MRVKNLIYKIVLFFLPSVAVFQGGSLDRYMLGESKFTYEGYTLERTITEEKNIYYSRITLKKGDAVIREFPRAQNGKKENTVNTAAFGFANLLKKDGKKEIIIKTFLTSEVKKYYYWVYAIEPDLRLVFETEKWKTGFVLGVDDIDNDNVKELIQTDLIFDEFDRCSHATSAIFDIYFRYDTGKGEYFPANHLYKKMVGNDYWAKEPLTKKDRGGVHLGSILKTLLPLIYSGQEKEAWKYFENDYVMPDKWGMQEKIRLRLLTDPVYKYIEQQGKEVERSLNIKP
ncbi:MAG: hypothetical protein A2452_03275 [Candidatus Firestonebacteria bacterium RIFOXYC2_FULL_39_67]|nr:MAG: hypothetical protein A2536_02690 [Candidatus Firestonebacteria bacterium RIFOXYD2_FULL_39_29]OGF55289.1 MAG: hypothetical protein A2452_03275 [Candidatus Firestonebacteria bacterium RIFOXYC2_FULL_39_67]